MLVTVMMTKFVASVVVVGRVNVVTYVVDVGIVCVAIHVVEVAHTVVVGAVVVEMYVVDVNVTVVVVVVACAGAWAGASTGIRIVRTTRITQTATTALIMAGLLKRTQSTSSA